MFSLHFIFRDQKHLAKVLADPAIAAEFRAMVKDSVQGAQVLGLLTMGMRNMYSKKEVKSIDDVKGQKVRVQATKTEDTLFPAYGAQTVHMPFGEVYTSLQTGVVNVAENGVNVYLANKHYEVAPILSMTEHEANNNCIWVSDKTWNSLTPEQQGWVQAAAAEVSKKEPAMALKLEKDSADKLKKMGVKVVEGVDKSGFIKAAQPVQDELAKELGPHAVKLLQDGPRSPVACDPVRERRARAPFAAACLAHPSTRNAMADYRALILQRHRQLKWKALDPLEALLMILCGVCIFMFTLTVLLDVVTRTIGAPWLWLQQVTTAFFAWGVFIGMAAATRRNDHFYLTEITKRMTGAPRNTIEIDQPPDRAGRGGVHRLVRLAERAPRPRQLPHAVADSADRLHGDRARVGRADRAVHDRAARQRLEERLRGARGPRRRAGDAAYEPAARSCADDRSCSCCSATWACRWRSR